MMWWHPPHDLTPLMRRGYQHQILIVVTLDNLFIGRRISSTAGERRHVLRRYSDMSILFKIYCAVEYQSYSNLMLLKHKLFPSNSSNSLLVRQVTLTLWSTIVINWHLITAACGQPLVSDVISWCQPLVTDDAPQAPGCHKCRMSRLCPRDNSVSGSETWSLCL